MTCVLASPPHVIAPLYDCSLMSSYSNMHMETGMEGQHGDYASSAESEPRRGSSSSGKKRPSRAGTRSVSTLSAAQLERKRANDREAQRAIRQRTKDHIAGLEKTLNDMRVAQDANEKMLAVTQQRNQELEDEVSYLRSRLGEAGYPASMPRRIDTQRLSDPAVGPVQAGSPSTQASSSSIPRPESTALSVGNSHPSSSRQGSWPHGQGPFGPSSAVATSNLATATPVAVGHPLTTWPSHDSTHSLQSGSSQLQDPSQAQAQAPYSAGPPTDRAPWATPTQGYSYQDAQRAQQFQASPNAAQQQYASAGYPAQQGPPATEFQALNVSSPATYQMPTAPNFPTATAYPLNPMNMPPENSDYAAAAAAQGQMQPPPLPAAHYHGAQAAPAPPSVQQQQQQQQFRDPSGNRTFSMTHYSSG